MKLRLPLINLGAYVALVLANILAIQLPFFGRTPGDVSDLYPNLLTPADFSFSIWSIIYILLGTYIFIEFKDWLKNTNKFQNETRAIGYYFLITCLLNITWLLTWQALQIKFAFLFIFVFWIVLIYINYKLTMIGNAHRIFRAAFSVYLGWICIAALANLNILFIDLGLNNFGLSEEMWTSILIVIGILGTFLVLFLNQDILFTLVQIWAYLGIYVKNHQLSNGHGTVATMALIAMLMLGIVSIGVFLKQQKIKKSKQKASH